MSDGVPFGRIKYGDRIEWDRMELEMVFIDMYAPTQKVKLCFCFTHESSSSFHS